MSQIAGEKQPLINQIVVDNDYPEFPNVSSGPEAEAGGSPQSESSSSDLEDKYHLDEIIPPTHSNRTIVLCFDGTGDQFDEDVCIPPLFFFT
jgi:hypothetical protein